MPNSRESRAGRIEMRQHHRLDFGQPTKRLLYQPILNAHQFTWFLRPDLGR